MKYADAINRITDLEIALRALAKSARALAQNEQLRGMGPVIGIQTADVRWRCTVAEEALSPLARKRGSVASLPRNLDIPEG